MAPQADVTGFSPNLAGMAPPPPQNTLQYLGQSSSLLDFIGRFVNRKQFQQQQNLQKAFNLIRMDDALSGAGAHGVIDHDAITKLLRKSGIPFTTDPQKLSQAMGAIAEEAGGQKTGTGPVGADPVTGGVMGVAPGSGPGAQPMQAPQGAPKYVQKAVDMYNRVKASGKPVTPEELWEMKLDVLAGRATQLQTAKENDELAKAELSEHISNLRNVVASAGPDSPEGQKALGRLHALNDIPEPTVDQQTFNMIKQNPKMLTEFLNNSLGHESEEKKSIRHQNGAMNALSIGMVSNLGDGLNLMNELESGHISPEMQKKLQPTTASAANDIALLGALEGVGFQGDQLRSAFFQAKAGGLGSVIPKNLQTQAMRNVQLERTRIQLELARTAAAYETAKGKLLSDEQKADLGNLQMLKQLKTDGVDIDPEMLKAAQEKVARSFNMKVTEVPGLLNRLTGGMFGGTETKFTRQVTPEDQAAIDRLAGGGGGGDGAGGAPGSTTTWTDAQGRVHTEPRDTGQQPGRQPGAPGRSLAQRVIEKGIQYFQGQNQQQQAKYGTRGIKLPRPSSATAAAPAAGNVRVKFGPDKDSWIDFAPGDVIDADGNTIQTLRDVGWTDDEIAEKIKESPPPAITPPASVGGTP